MKVIFCDMILTMCFYQRNLPLCTCVSKNDTIVGNCPVKQFISSDPSLFLFASAGNMGKVNRMKILFNLDFRRVHRMHYLCIEAHNI